MLSRFWRGTNSSTRRQRVSRPRAASKSRHHTSKTLPRIESLEQRTLFAVIPASLAQDSPIWAAVAASQSPVIAEQTSRGVFFRASIDASVAPKVPANSLTSNLNGNGLQFNLIPTGNVTPQALTAFQQAANIWSSILTDDIMVNINIDFMDLGPGILGGAVSVSQSNSVTAFRTALTGDSKSLTDQTAVANLPTGNALSLYTSNPATGAAQVDNDGSTNNTTLDVNTALAKAVGLLSANNSALDADLTIGSAVPWDFDPSNGINANEYDFIGTVVHEIGHVLGFTSGADTVDVTSGAGPAAPVNLNGTAYVAPLDLFRFSTASISNNTALDVRADSAPKFFSLDHNVTQLTTYSTGGYNGDGFQASHWEDDGNNPAFYIGVMDPNGINGEFDYVTNLDVIAFDAIGWDVRMDFGDAPDSGVGTGAGNYNTNLNDNGPRHALFEDSGLFSDLTGAAKVYLGTGVTREFNGQPNATATGDTDDGVTIPPVFNAGSTVNVSVQSTAAGARLDYFFDFNADGDFTDPGETFNAVLTSATQTVPVVVPPTALTGTTFARFRISTAGSLGPTGPANDGEVEDYQVNVSQLGFSIDDVSVNEGDTGSTSAVFTISQTAPAAQNVTIVYNTAAVSATAGSDFIAQSGTLTFTPGTVTRTVTIQVLGDLAIEGPETFNVNLSGATGGIPVVKPQGVGTIVDDDLPILAIGDVFKAEGKTGNTDFVFNVTTSLPYPQPMNVSFTTSNGTALAGSDYVAKSGVLTFAPNVQSQTITITVKGDTVVEPQESFRVVLSNPVNSKFGDSEAIGWIQNDDSTLPGSPSTMTITDATVTTTPAGTGFAVFTVALGKASSQPVTVKYATANGTALAGFDYQPTTGTLTFQPGTTTQSIVVPVLNAPGTGSKKFTVNLSGETNAQVLDRIADGTIVRTAVTQTFEQIKDDGDSGVLLTGTWSNNTNSQANLLDFKLSQGTGAHRAQWSFYSLPAGTYEVYTTWVPFSNRATSAPFQILDGTTSRGTVSVNQRVAPTGTTVNGHAWKSLGVFTVNSQTLVVRLTDGSGGAVVADAIRIVQRSTTAPLSARSFAASPAADFNTSPSTPASIETRLQPAAVTPVTTASTSSTRAATTTQSLTATAAKKAATATDRAILSLFSSLKR